MALYFAYGANLDLRGFRRRCPGATIIGRARLSGYRLCFTRYSRAEKGGVADIVPEPDTEVWGALYDESRRNRILAQADSETICNRRSGRCRIKILASRSRWRTTGKLVCSLALQALSGYTKVAKQGGGR